MEKEAAIVYLFVEDSEDDESQAALRGDATAVALSAEDITEWLEIIGKVEYVKLQFDSTSGRACFCVCFRRAESAKLACTFLDGVKLKNCLIRIHSRVHKPAAKEEPGDAGGRGRAVTPSTAAKEEEGGRPSKGLPHNHLLPATLRMDPELADLLDPSRGGGEATSEEGWAEHSAQLRASQKALCRLLSAIATAKERLATVDREIAEVRRRQCDAEKVKVDGGTGGQEHVDLTGRSGAASSPTVRTGSAIATSRCSPAALLSFISERFGPLAWCHCILDSTGDVDRYFLSLAFMMAADCAAFLAFCGSKSTVEGRREAKRSRREPVTTDEDDAATTAESAVLSTHWVEQ